MSDATDRALELAREVWRSMDFRESVPACQARIAQALRTYGDERLDEAASLRSLNSGHAAAIRALKEKP